MFIAKYRSQTLFAARKWHSHFRAAIVILVIPGCYKHSAPPERVNEARSGRQMVADERAQYDDAIEQRTVPGAR
jgi:hypothetical protein